LKRDFRDVLAKLTVGVLFVLLSINLFGDFQKTHHVTGLLLLVGEALVVVLTVVRRPAGQVDRSTVARAMAVVSMIGPVLLRVGDAHSLVPDVMSAAVSIVGLSLVIAGKLTLGRSFGIVAANRGVVASGPYLVVRHPIYVGYLISHAAFLAAHPSGTNIAVILIADSALVVRALIEERTLELDERYQMYCQRVGWHFVPGVF
jgi:protein-S-isoprenylcysteine O-methyltransferase Ste14